MPWVSNQVAQQDLAPVWRIAGRLDDGAAIIAFHEIGGRQPMKPRRLRLSCGYAYGLGHGPADPPLWPAFHPFTKFTSVIGGVRANEFPKLNIAWQAGHIESQMSVQADLTAVFMCIDPRRRQIALLEPVTQAFRECREKARHVPFDLLAHQPPADGDGRVEPKSEGGREFRRGVKCGEVALR